MKTIIRTVLFSLSLTGAMISLSVAQEIPQAPGSLPNNRIGDSDLRAFAKAYIEFEKIRGEYEPKLNTANSPQEKGAVEQEAVAKLNKALESEGMTMQQYGALYQTVSVDPQLREKVLRLIDEERGKL
jgi:hypothetical protein